MGTSNTDGQEINETAYLMQSPQNARRLMGSISRLEAGGTARAASNTTETKVKLTPLQITVGQVPSQEELVDLYTAVGWTAYTDNPADLVPMCAGSLYLACARDASGHLVGLVRAVGDGVSISYIQDLLVHPRYQRHGVGGQLLGAALDAVGNVRQVYITTDTHATNQHVIDLYLGKGFKPIGDYNCVTLARLH